MAAMSTSSLFHRFSIRLIHSAMPDTEESEESDFTSFEVLLGVPPEDQSEEAQQVTRETPSASDESRGDDRSSNQYNAGPSSTTSRSRRPRSYQRHCYHSIVDRQWRIDQSETCELCGRRPSLRWFYICTEDTSGYTGPIDRDTFLSPWITEAILAGEYTDAQRDILMEQKLQVLRLCERERNPSTPSLSDEARASKRQESKHAAEHGSQLHSLDSDDESDSGMSQLLPFRSRCNYRACHQCDRRLLERSWASMDEICNDPEAKPTVWDLWDRPVSDARIVRNLGLRSSPPPRPPPPPPPHYSQCVQDSPRRPRIRRSPGFYRLGHCSIFSAHGYLSSLPTIEEVNEEETDIRCYYSA